jgi:hypothetical protein
MQMMIRFCGIACLMVVAARHTFTFDGASSVDTNIIVLYGFVCLRF